MKKTKLRKQSKSPTAQCKQRIQNLLREIVMARDGGCILRFVRPCGGEIGQATIQADHLLPRSNSATYADSRLVVCVCKSCHGWKQWWKEEYDALVKTILPKDRVALWDRCEKERQAHRPKQGINWFLTEKVLEMELKKL